MSAVERIERTFARAGARGRLHVVDLDDDRHSVSAGADTAVAMASVFKLAVLAELYRAAGAGRVRLADRLTVRGDGIGLTGISQLRDPVEMSLRDLAQSMITVSDCAAADALFDLLGEDAINANLRRLGLERTAVRGCCRDMFAARSPAALARTTPREMTRLLAAIWSDAAADPAACAEMRRMMSLQVWPHRLASGFPDDAVRVAGKTGTLPRIRNEVGVVEFADGGRYAAAVFTTTDSTASTLPAVDAAIGTAARIAVDALRDQAADARRLRSRAMFAGAIEFPEGTRTAADAAAAIGCEVGQIVKSLVFRDGADGPAVLVLCSGANTVDAKRLGLAKADAEFVRRVSGYAIGGVPPWGWATAPERTLVDRALLAHEEIWAAAGTPRSVFPLTPDDLLARTGGRVADVAA